MFSYEAPSPKLQARGQAAGLRVSQELLDPRDWEFGGAAGLCIWAQGGMQAADGASVCRNSVLRCWHDGPPGTTPCAREGNGAVGCDLGV